MSYSQNELLSKTQIILKLSFVKIPQTTFIGIKAQLTYIFDPFDVLIEQYTLHLEYCGLLDYYQFSLVYLGRASKLMDSLFSGIVQSHF